MKKILFCVLSIFLIFSISGCSKENVLTEKDVKMVIEENNLNVLNLENCGYNGDDLELSIENVTIEKSNIHKDDASCDAKLTLSNNALSAEIFYRFDLKMGKDGWKLTDFKNYKKYTLTVNEEIDDKTILEDAKNSVSEDYTYTVKSTSEDEKKFTYTAILTYKGENDISSFSGTVTLTYKFDMETFKWTLENVDEEASKVDSWEPEGQWRFKDTSYYYKIDLSAMDIENETAKIKVIASEYESVIDTAEFQQEIDVILTQSGDDIYLEPIEVELPENTVSLMLCIRNDGLYFATDQSGEYKKTNLPRYTENKY